MSNLVEKWKKFCEWQQRPYQVAKKSEEHHCCHTCGEEYLGNYCPRCGQSFRIGRYSFKNAMMLFLQYCPRKSVNILANHHSLNSLTIV